MKRQTHRVFPLAAPRLIPLGLMGLSLLGLSLGCGGQKRGAEAPVALKTPPPESPDEQPDDDPLAFDDPDAEQGELPPWTLRCGVDDGPVNVIRGAAPSPARPTFHGFGVKLARRKPPSGGAPVMPRPRPPPSPPFDPPPPPKAPRPVLFEAMAVRVVGAQGGSANERRSPPMVELRRCAPLFAPRDRGEHEMRVSLARNGSPLRVTAMESVDPSPFRRCLMQRMCNYAEPSSTPPKAVVVGVRTHRKAKEARLPPDPEPPVSSTKGVRLSVRGRLQGRWTDRSRKRRQLNITLHRRFLPLARACVSKAAAANPTHSFGLRLRRAAPPNKRTRQVATLVLPGRRRPPRRASGCLAGVMSRLRLPRGGRGAQVIVEVRSRPQKNLVRELLVPGNATGF